WGCYVDNCYSTGSVTGNDDIGGFLGENNLSQGGSVDNCYCTGSVTGTTTTGGFIGTNGTTGTQTNCFWNTDVFAAPGVAEGSSDGLYGKTTAEMKTEGTFTNAGWDFWDESANGMEEIWAIDGTTNDGYPFLNEPQGTPVDYVFTNSTIADGENACFNALNTVTVAGDDGPVVLENNSVVTLIAAQSIHFLHGFHAQNGSYLDAHITTTASFCDQAGLIPDVLPPVVKSQNLESLVEEQALQPDIKKMKLYPNPCSGMVTASLTHCPGLSELSILSSSGAVVYRTYIADTPETVHPISFLRRGLYLVRIRNGASTLTQKLLINN
ncbi:MAG TPA: T9SS type A sorting domain-containing protein, partial [Prolixibacteraceae bacterium]|nr:T9SS type A sorting domain-containing protein [Prolixibacteraceae bacterium]